MNFKLVEWILTIKIKNNITLLKPKCTVRSIFFYFKHEKINFQTDLNDFFTSVISTPRKILNQFI